MTPERMVRLIDEFFNDLMKSVPADYSVSVTIVNHCPWMFSLIFPATKTFWGKLPRMKEPEDE